MRLSRPRKIRRRALIRGASPYLSSFKNTGEPVSAWNDIQAWVPYDLISSDRPTPAKAMEQALGFLEMRCG